MVGIYHQEILLTCTILRVELRGALHILTASSMACIEKICQVVGKGQNVTSVCFLSIYGRFHNW